MEKSSLFGTAQSGGNGSPLSAENLPSNHLISRLNEYDEFVVFHGCRPTNLESYYTEGFKIANIDELNEIARAMLHASQYPEITEAIFDEAIAGASRYHDKHLFFVIDEREISGHYLIYGSEHIAGIAALIHRAAGIDCKYILKRSGTPTVFRIALSRALIPNKLIEALASDIRAIVWDERRREGPPRFDWSFILREPVPYGHVIDHVHPESIPDPHMRNYPYRYRENFPDF
jgi:hypothetical protein